jgi:hypothetical protein
VPLCLGLTDWQVCAQNQLQLSYFLTDFYE